MCIGNRYNGDDAIGPYVADKLKQEDLDEFLILDCSTVPENFTSLVKKNNPTNLIIVDATDMGLSSGEMRRISKDMIGSMHVSTHNIPLSILVSYLEHYVKNVFIIGIQPENMDGSMGEEVKKSGDKLVELIKNKKFLEIKMLER
ncbi:MAG TPA: hydrogenase maturation peptidase HycI [Methanomicrobia archaeon]|nr:MAG: hydrogenase maturation peptidase HycI [Thermococci archaeon]HHF09713.1 hydrogenase maturation peptidase HycI [Methanomicrobia archaeon]